MSQTAILRLPMPESCWECPLFVHDPGDSYAYGCRIGSPGTIPGGHGTRAERSPYCPLTAEGESQ